MVRYDQIETKEGIILEVGSTVEITKSDIHWNSGGKMDEYDKKRVIITSIINSDRIRFENDKNWHWRYSSNHFKPIEICHELW